MPVLAKIMSNYISASVALSFGGFLNGYDTGSIGAIVHMEQFEKSVGKLSSFVLGFTVSIILLTGVVPVLFAGHFADKYGRLRVILPGALLFGLGAVIQATSFSLGQFIAGRAISGAGQGVLLSNISVYITEIAPFSRRGRLAALPQFMATIGICIGYFCCYGTAETKSSLAWRLPYIIPVTVSAGLAWICKVLPESPRWLMLHGKGEAAVEALKVLDFDMDEARRDFLENVQEQPSITNWQSFVLLFRGNYRSRTLLALFVMAMVQLSGIDAITYYAPVLFVQAGVTGSNASLIASGVASITMFIISIPGFMLADKWGRRTCAITGGLLLAGLMILIGSLYAADAVHPSGIARWVVVVSVFLFGMIFCATWGILGRIYPSEIQPGNTRAAGNAVGMACSFFTNFLVALVVPILLSASAFGAYFLFGGLVIFGTAVLAIYMPETRGRSLEAIQTDFQGPGKAFLSRLFRSGGSDGKDEISPPATPTVESPANRPNVSLEMQSVVERTTTASSASMEAAARGLRVGTV